MVVADELAPSVTAPLARTALLVKAALDAVALVGALSETGVTHWKAQIGAWPSVWSKHIQAIAAVTDLAVLAIAIAVVAQSAQSDRVLLFIDAALLQFRAELAVHEVKALGVVTAAFGAGECLIRFVNAAFQLQFLANREAPTVQAADLACGTSRSPQHDPSGRNAVKPQQRQPGSQHSVSHGVQPSSIAGWSGGVSGVPSSAVSARLSWAGSSAGVSAGGSAGGS